jgi:protocatechuate 3,4-dioxygenase beta subunit
MQDSASQNGKTFDPDAPVSSDAAPSSGPSRRSGVSGRVLDPSGNPVVGAVVVPRSQDSPPQELPEIAVMTDDDGRYQWTLPPGRYSFTVHHNGHASSSQTVVVAADQVGSLDITIP